MDGMLLWQNLYDVLARVIKWSVIAAVISTALILVLSVTDIIGSKFFNQGFPGANAFVEELNLVVVFMAIAYVQLERRHMSITMLHRFMSSGVKHAITLFGDVLGILACGFFSWRTFILMRNMIAISDIKNAAAIEFPLWPFALVNFYGFAILTIAFIMCFVKGIITGSDE
jgi:TRAP-type C4-dicarboxylate transport system permease small subunit